SEILQDHGRGVTPWHSSYSATWRGARPGLIKAGNRHAVISPTGTGRIAPICEGIMAPPCVLPRHMDGFMRSMSSGLSINLPKNLSGVNLARCGSHVARILL